MNENEKGSMGSTLNKSLGKASTRKVVMGAGRVARSFEGILGLVVCTREGSFYLMEREDI